jgi:hypothetical protein
LRVDIIDREEHFYQLGLRQFGAFNRLRLDPPPSLSDLIELAAEDEAGIKANNLDFNTVITVCRFFPFKILTLNHSQSQVYYKINVK